MDTWANVTAAARGAVVLGDTAGGFDPSVWVPAAIALVVLGISGFLQNRQANRTAAHQRELAQAAAVEQRAMAVAEWKRDRRFTVVSQVMAGHLYLMSLVAALSDAHREGRPTLQIEQAIHDHQEQLLLLMAEVQIVGTPAMREVERDLAVFYYDTLVLVWHNLDSLDIEKLDTAVSGPGNTLLTRFRAAAVNWADSLGE